MVPLPLFRATALAAQRSDALGAVSLACPLSFVVLSGLLGAIAAALGVFAWLGEYTAHETLQGRLMPLGGIVEIAAPQAGVVLERRGGAGLRVAAGDPLYVISGERTSRGYGATQAAIATQLERRRASLLEQAESTRALERAERAALAARLTALAREQRLGEAAVEAQRARVVLASAGAERAERLRLLGHLSTEQGAQKDAELLEQRARLTALERETAALERLRAELDGRVATLGAQYANELAELERALVATELEMAASEAQRAVVVTAPRAGIVTSVSADVGQPVEPGTVLAALVPEDARLVAELYAPSRALGFVEPGDAVRLRHAAFPYQKFGHALGSVLEVAASPLGAAPATAAARGEPLYRIVVGLESQTVTAQGAARPLLAGMSVEAEVLLETRRLYEWLFEPLLGLARSSAR